MRWLVWLRLARVSNLPTVWTNVLAGAFLSGVRPGAGLMLRLVVSMSLLYSAGMMLNDAFDRDVDARERPDRPIPSGLITAREVFTAGFGLLALGLVLLIPEPRALLPGLLLALGIVAYDCWHKANPAGPFVMAACRALVYATAAVAASGRLAPPVVVGATLVFAYVAALTLWAKRRGSHVATLIAGISLLDALLVWWAGAPLWAVVAAAGFSATRRLQRFVQGT